MEPSILCIPPSPMPYGCRRICDYCLEFYWSSIGFHQEIVLKVYLILVYVIIILYIYLGHYNCRL